MLKPDHSNLFSRNSDKIVMNMKQVTNIARKKLQQRQNCVRYPGLFSAE